MIVRILTEGQYELDEKQYEQLNRYDNTLVELVEAGDAVRFSSTFQELLRFVRSSGRRLADEELAPSTLILPAPDSTMDELKQLFVSEGLVPDRNP